MTNVLKNKKKHVYSSSYYFEVALVISTKFSTHCHCTIYIVDRVMNEKKKKQSRAVELWIVIDHNEKAGYKHKALALCSIPSIHYHSYIAIVRTDSGPLPVLFSSNRVYFW